jgi:uncharacterized protein YjbI with pentapeptide repeats
MPVKRGGSKCSVKKQKAECDAAANECVWGKTGKCSQKRKPGNKKASVASASASASAVSLHQFFPSVAKQASPKSSIASLSPVASLSPMVSLSPAASPKSQGSPKSHISLLSQGSQDSYEEEEQQQPLVKKTKEDFQPGATLQNVRANAEVDLRGRNLKGIKILGGNMVNVDLTGADLSGATLTDIVMGYAKMDGADLTGATISGCNFERAELNGAHLTKAKVSDCDLREVSAKKIQMNGCTFTNVVFMRTNFMGANVVNAKFEGAETALNFVSFEEADLTRAEFSYDVPLANPDFDPHSRFDQGYFMNFKGATLANVKFPEEANMSHNNFHGANLTGVQLWGRDLQHCDFIDANLEDVDLSEADLRNARITMADLKNVASIDGASFNNLKLEPYSVRMDKELRATGVLRLD